MAPSKRTPPDVVPRNKPRTISPALTKCCTCQQQRNFEGWTARVPCRKQGRPGSIPAGYQRRDAVPGPLAQPVPRAGGPSRAGGDAPTTQRGQQQACIHAYTDQKNVLLYIHPLQIWYVACHRDLLPNIAGTERSSVPKLNFREAGRRGQRTGVSYCCTPEWRSHSYYLAPRSQSPAVYLRRSVSRRRPLPGLMWAKHQQRRTRRHRPSCVLYCRFNVHSLERRTNSFLPSRFERYSLHRRKKITGKTPSPKRRTRHTINSANPAKPNRGTTKSTDP